MSSNRTWQQRFQDMLDSAQRILRYTRGMTYQDFIDDRRTFDAVLHNFAVIGESANRIPHEIRARLPDVPWRDMVGLRIIIVHIYFRIKEPPIWRAVTELPSLMRQLEDYLQSPHTP